MYYVFETDWAVLKSEEQMLMAVDYPSNVRTPREYFLAEPLPEPFRSMKYFFSVPNGMKRPFPDNWVAEVPFYVFSNRLVDLSRYYNVPHESFASYLISRETHEIISDSYVIFNLLAKAQCFDMKKSSTGIKITRLVLSSEFEKSGLMMARDTHHVAVIIVHEKFKMAIEDAGIIGCHFTPVEEYRRGA